HGHVLGFYGTHGSFALTSGETLMPAGLAVSYPLGRSLDDKYAIQIDSDSTKNGGVIPDIRVPFTRENMNAMCVDSEDVVLNYAIEFLNDISSLIDNQDFQPKTPQLLGNYPNPFNPETTIRYNLPQSTKVKIIVYDIAGHQVKTLVNEYKHASRYEIVFNGSQLASGVYFYTLEAGEFRDVKKMILLK
ncbi:MAG: T9SS type A sorting domain-containing protein, partial [bacterium]